MKTKRVVAFLVLSFLLVCIRVNAKQVEDTPISNIDPLIGSWTFSGKVTNESEEQYGYFFQVHRQGNLFKVKTALIDGQTNQLKWSYEDSAVIENAALQNWHIGHAVMRFNPINDSWVIGVKLTDNQGFNFKIDMLQQAEENGFQSLRPGVQVQALQTSRLNGHIKTSADDKEQFVTGNNAWFGKIWFDKKQETPHDISMTFCRLNNENGFYSANLKEADATGAAIAGWRDNLGNKVRMSQFVSIKKEADDQCLLHVALPKLRLHLTNTLKDKELVSEAVAGFAKDTQSFCFISEQKFALPNLEINKA